ncbi:MAG: hypothetical protein AAFQ07_10465 [Chloroflexota bacterium]
MPKNNRELQRQKKEANRRAKAKLKEYVAEQQATREEELGPRERQHVYMVILHNIYLEMGLTELLPPPPDAPEAH